jgi:AraC-like DNA-binding protein
MSTRYTTIPLIYQPPDREAVMHWYKHIDGKWRHAIDISKAADTRPNRPVRKFLKSIANFSEQEHELRFYAGRLNMSPDNLRKLCAEVGIYSPSDCIHLYMLKKSIPMLNNALKDIGEIGLDLGFSAHAHFSTFFKRTSGITPTQYRKLMGLSRSGHRSGRDQSNSRML